MASLTSSSLTWEDVIGNGDSSQSTVTLDSSDNAISVSGTVAGEWGSGDNSINGLVITGSNTVKLSGSGTLIVTGTTTFNDNTIIDGITLRGESSVTGGTVTIQNGGTLITQRDFTSNVVFGPTSSSITNTLQLDSSSRAC